MPQFQFVIRKNIHARQNIRRGVMRIIICPICKKEWQLRGRMAFESLSRHLREEHGKRAIGGKS